MPHWNPNKHQDYEVDHGTLLWKQLPGPHFFFNLLLAGDYSTKADTYYFTYFFAFFVPISVIISVYVLFINAEYML